MKINIEGYDITGTPSEILELLDLLAEEVAAVENPPVETPERPAAKPKAKPAAADKTKTRKIDWNKARALREAGWSYVKIGEELGVSDVTVAAHLRKTHLM
jgi:hypothetical protein